MVPPLASIEHDDHGSIRILRIIGEVDMDNTGQIDELLSTLVPDGAAAVVVDLTDLTYLDSAGIRLLVEFSDRLRRSRQQLRLVVPPESRLRRILALVKLELLIPIDDDRPTAVAQLGLD